MLTSPQFDQSHQLAMVLEDLRGIDSIGARHGQQEQWNAIVGCAPTEAEQWRQVDPIMEAGQRCVVISVSERVRHGPLKGGHDVAMPYICSGWCPPASILERLRLASAFFAEHRNDPGRSKAHEAWGSGSHRMAGRRANPLDGDVGNYAPRDNKLLNNAEWCAAELEHEASVGAWLQLADAELRRVCPTHHARCNTPRDHTHTYEQANKQRIPSWPVPQTTAACAIDYPAFGAHADPNVGFLSPFAVTIPARVHAPSPVLQFVNGLAYTKQLICWFHPDCLHAFRPHESLLTREYADYARKPREAPQNAAWHAAREVARAAAKASILAEGGTLTEAELNLKVQLECGPLPWAGLVQERSLSHMRTQKAEDLGQGATAKKQAEAKPAGGEPAPKVKKTALEKLAWQLKCDV